MRTRKIQSKVEPELEKHIQDLKEFNGMSNYIRQALIEKSKSRIKKLAESLK